MTSSSARSFKIGIKLLKKFVRHDWNYSFFGDIEEMYNRITQERGWVRANIWFWFQVLRTFPAFIQDLIYWGAIMFKNYFLVTIRNIRRHKGYSFINIIGLAAGLATCILIMIWVQDELSFDRFHEQAPHIYRIESNVNTPQGIYHSPATPAPLAPAAQEEIPEIEYATRCSRFGGMHIRYKDNVYFENIIHCVDPSFFHIFSFPMIKGDGAGNWDDPYSLILTEKTAQKYFGDEDPIGAVVTVENKYDLTIVGVMQDPPENSTIQFDGLVPFPFVRDSLERMPSGWVNAISNFVLLNENSSVAAVSEKITVLVRENSKNDKLSYELAPLTRIHLHSSYGRNDSPGLILYVYIFSLIAIFVLIVAAINFINLSTARSVYRSKEIGMRKVIGAKRNSLIRQFLGESVLMSGAALLFAIAMVMVLLPVFNSLSWKSFSLSRLIDPGILLGMLILTLLTGLAAGFYPAIVLSGLRPFRALKEMPYEGRAALRKFLVVFQFAVSILLIIGTLIVLKQVRFMKTSDLGYDKDHLVLARMSGETPLSYEAIKTELLKNPRILSVTACGRRPSFITDTGQNIDWDNKDPQFEPRIVFHTVDYDYVETMGIEIVEGRSFNKKIPSDRKSAFLVNEELARLMGDGSAVGKNFSIFWMKGKVIGVMKNFHHRPMRDGIEPLVFLMAPNPYWLGTLVMKVHPEGVAGTIAGMKETWKNLVPDFPFETSFLSEDFGQMYRLEDRLARLLGYFSILAVIIACLGLFGLASYTAVQKTKEIGIRKILGASVPQIIMMLSQGFLKWVILANLFAWPVGWYVMKNWLRNFSYHTLIGIEIFILAGAVALAIALLTIGYQAFKAASSNPIDSLRYE